MNPRTQALRRSTASALRRSSPLRKVSAKRAKELRVYAVKRKAYLEISPWCYLCGAWASDIHHKDSRIGAKLNDEKQWMPLCRKHHRYLHDHPKWARANGYLQ